jgi:hypothetical protein
MKKSGLSTSWEAGKTSGGSCSVIYLEHVLGKHAHIWNLLRRIATMHPQDLGHPTSLGQEHGTGEL